MVKGSPYKTTRRGTAEQTKLKISHGEQLEKVQIKDKENCLRNKEANRKG